MFQKKRGLYACGMVVAFFSIVCVPARTETSAADLPPEASAEWFSEIQQNIAASEYHMTWQDKTYLPDVPSAWHAPNRAHNLRSYFTAQGPRVVPRTGDTSCWVWGLELTGIGTGDGAGTPPPPIIDIMTQENRLAYIRADLTEWYVNDPCGLEQGFTLDAWPGAAPSAESGNVFFLDMAVRGTLRPGMMPDGETVEFISPGGVSILHYGKLFVTDAEDRELPATLSVVENADGDAILRIRVDASDALYPITIDPLATDAGWAAQSGQENALFGWSVATAGDVNGDGYSDVIVGAPMYDTAHSDAGAVFVFYGSPNGLSLAPDWEKTGDEANDWFGYSVSTAGDVNGDGHSGVLVGAPYAGTGNQGYAVLIHDPGLGIPDILVLMPTAQADARFGWSVATAGDVNGDGYSDVIIGAPYYDDQHTDEGKVFVYHGSEAGLATGPAWTATGEQANAHFGYSVAFAGDVNGDGYSDVIVGAPDYSYWVLLNTGRVFVYHGSSTGLSTTAAWTMEGDQGEARLGWSVATAGDVNGDGYSDIIVGEPDYDHGLLSNAGRVFVYHGSSTGLSITAAWTVEGDQEEARLGWSVATAGDVNGNGYADVIIGAPYYDDEGTAFAYFGSSTGLQDDAAWTASSNQANARFGWSVATAGDVNGDGYSDVIVGAPYYNQSETNEGRALVYCGGVSVLGETPGWTADGNQAVAMFGYSVSTAGDVNGDGYSDVIVGAYSYDAGANGEGRAYVYHGSATGLSSDPAWTAEGGQGGANFGWSVSTAGDVNGDGYSDVIIGARHHTDTVTREGKAYVYHGGPSGLSNEAAWTAVGLQWAAMFGYSVSTAGDVNGDGYSDVIIGAPDHAQTETREGKVYVYYGSAQGLNQEADWTAVGGLSHARFGRSVSEAGDVNGDGYSDIIIGAPTYGSNAGRVFVYHGSADGVLDSPDWSFESDQDNAYLGASVSTAGDVNGDGYSDIIVGAPYYNMTHSSEGAAAVFHGSANGLESDAAWYAGGGQDDAGFGYSVSTAGDVNGDGYSDVIISAFSYSDTETNEGKAYVYHGSAKGLEIDAAWTATGSQAHAYFGRSVSTAGDVNGDGFSDVIVGASSYKVGGEILGRVFLYHGNGEAGPGVSLTPQQRRSDNAAPIARLGRSENNTSVRLNALGHTPYGRSQVKLKAEIVPLGTPLDGATHITTYEWHDTGTDGVELSMLLPELLTIDTLYHWRMRLVYHPATNPFQQKSRWFRIPWNGLQEADFRTNNDTTPPEPPIVTGMTPTNNQMPTWHWTTGGGDGNGWFRRRLDSEGSFTLTTDTQYAPDSPLPEGDHTLYVQERDDAGNWSDSGQFTITVDITPPVALCRDIILFLDDDGNAALEPADVDDGSHDNIGIVHWSVSPDHFSCDDIAGSPHTVTLTVEDAAGNTNACTASVVVADELAPTIILEGDNPMFLQCGTAYAEPGVSVLDNCDASPLLEVTGTVDHLVPGDYVVTYTCVDLWLNEAVETRLVQVRDTLAPQIELLGDDPLLWECGTPYEDPGASAGDLCEGDISDHIQVDASVVNAQVLGVYPVTYQVVDGSGNESEILVREVNIVDETPPALFLGAWEPTIIFEDAFLLWECGAAFDEPGNFSALDACAGELGLPKAEFDPDAAGVYAWAWALDELGEPLWEMVGDEWLPVAEAYDVFTGITGDYLILYDARDGNGNGYPPLDADGLPDIFDTEGNLDILDGVGNLTVDFARLVRVADTELPVITLLGESEVTLDCGATYEDAGADAWDDCDGDLSGAIMVDNPVDTAMPGIYSVTYDVSDAEGNAALPVSRIVTVLDNCVTEGEAPAEGEGEAPAEGEAPTEGEGEAPAEGEGEAPAEGEGEAPAEGEGEAPTEGEGEAPAEGEGEPVPSRIIVPEQKTITCADGFDVAHEQLEQAFAAVTVMQGDDGLTRDDIRTTSIVVLGQDGNESTYDMDALVMLGAGIEGFGDYDASLEKTQKLFHYYFLFKQGLYTINYELATDDSVVDTAVQLLMIEERCQGACGCYSCDSCAGCRPIPATYQELKRIMGDWLLVGVSILALLAVAGGRKRI